jgi:cation diffusion facilitator CzcD-associated flavoprotein CzcO
MPGDRSISVVIVGAGIGGIAAAIELRRHGFDDVTVLERGSRLGGTWHYNDYPGCACDVPSHLYSFSYAQRRDWSRLCSPQQEILGYLTSVAREHKVDGLVVYGADVTSCEWDGGWTVSCADGRAWKADALLIATGQLHQPAVPAIPGQFEGRSFHSSRWDHSFDLRGRRVAVIGTCASAVQFVPRVAEQAERLYVFQRSGNWFWPRRNRPYPDTVELVTDPIARFEPGGIVTTDGVVHEVDCVIYGTGFKRCSPGSPAPPGPSATRGIATTAVGS